MKSQEQLLIEDAGRTRPDEGYTARVLGALPAPAPRRAGWRPLLILGSTALGCLLAALFAPAGGALMQGFVDIAASRYLTPGALAIAGTAMSLAVAGAILAAED